MTGQAAHPPTVHTDAAGTGLTLLTTRHENELHGDVELHADVGPSDGEVLADGGTLVGVGFVMACSACRLSGGPFTAAEGLRLAGEHDQVHHHGARTAQVSDQWWCESCRLRPAATTWAPPTAVTRTGTGTAVEPAVGPGPDGVAPFRLCHRCATATTDDTTGPRP